jgi:transcriptional regulator with XRE-family HTH domain
MEVKKIHVGKLIHSAIKESNSSFVEVARKMGVSRQKLNGWCQKEDLFVKDLFTISEAIDRDLVKFFCLPKEDEQEKKIFIQIEIEKNKTEDILKIINDKHLYNILKK